MSKYYMTKNCVYCLTKPAVSWCGHIKRKKKTISAGWCKRHRDVTGFAGHYKKKMGRVEEILE